MINESLPNTISKEEQAKVKEFMAAFLKDKKKWIEKYGLEQANFVMYKTAVKKAKKEFEGPQKVEETLRNHIKNIVKEIILNDKGRNKR